MDTEKLLTVPEVAEILRVSPSTVYRRIQAGGLPAIKLGHRQVRIKQEDLDAYIDAHRITPTRVDATRALSAGVGELTDQEPVDEEPDRHDETGVDADPEEWRQDTPPASLPPKIGGTEGGAAGRGAG